MESTKQIIYRHIDKHGFKIVHNLSFHISFDFQEWDVKTGPVSRREFPNEFGIGNEEHEKYILDYIFDTTGFRIDALKNIHKYSHIDGLPFIITVFNTQKHESVYSLAFGTINGTLTLKESDKILSLGNIKQINGDLIFRGSLLSSLGNLNTVNGSIYVRQFDPPFTKLTSLGNLELVTGNLVLKQSPVEDLGSLKRVGQNLNLRKTAIKSLNNLEYVGGDLFLPKSVKNNIDISKMTVKGNLKYFSN